MSTVAAISGVPTEVRHTKATLVPLRSMMAGFRASARSRPAPAWTMPAASRTSKLRRRGSWPW